MTIKMTAAAFYSLEKMLLNLLRVKYSNVSNKMETIELYNCNY